MTNYDNFSSIDNYPVQVTAADVAQAGFSGLMQSEKIVIPGLINKILAFTVRFTPRSVMTLIARSLNQKESVTVFRKKKCYRL